MALARAGGVDSAPAAGDEEGLIEADLGVPVNVQRDETYLSCMYGPQRRERGLQKLFPLFQRINDTNFDVTTSFAKVAFLH